MNGLCRCCLSEGKFRSLDAPYKCDGNDSYTVLLRETFNITISPMPGPDNASTYTICGRCTSQLQDAAQFRDQVLECDKKFAAYVENYLRGDHSFSADKIQIEAETLQGEEIEYTSIVKEDLETDNATSMAMSPDEGNDYVNEFDYKIDICDDDNRNGDERYPCDICNENFRRIDKLRSHVLDNHIFSQDSREFVCACCDIAFNERNSLKKHMMLKHEKAKYHCAFCIDTFPTFDSVKTHELTHTKKSGYICDYCQKGYKYKVTLKRHINYHTGNYKKYICETCGVTTKQASDLKVHIRNVHEKVQFKCDLCPKTYKLKNHLMEHRRVVHTGELAYECYIKQGQARTDTEIRPDNLNNECPICGKRFEYKSFLKQHLHSHTKPFKCHVCGEHFSRKDRLVQHQERHGLKKGETETERKNHCGNRTNDLRYSCDFCKEIFCRKDKLRSHLLAKHMAQDSRDILSCPSCDTSFDGRKSCIKHMMLKHIIRAEYHCAFCIDTFPTLKSLRTHELTHTKKSGYICDYCQRGFKHKKTLQRHIYQHMGNNKEYICETCGCITKQASDLIVHIRSVHEDIRPFKCDVCPKTYKMKKHLIDHRRVIHIGVLPFKCDVCFQRFRAKSHFNKHKRRHRH